jgi:hypothetical protein
VGRPCCCGGQGRRLSLKVHAGGVFLPWAGHRAGRIAGDPTPMRYYRSAEMAIALSFGLTFALVGWWEIAGQVWGALWWPLK